MASRARFELYRDAVDEWRWRLVVPNGNPVADGGEGYTSKRSAKRGVESVETNAPEADVVEPEGCRGDATGHRADRGAGRTASTRRRGRSRGSEKLERSSRGSTRDIDGRRGSAALAAGKHRDGRTS